MIERPSRGLRPLSTNAIDWPRVALIAAIVCALTIAAVNAARGDRLGDYYAEYAGGGSCKLRGDDAFHRLIMVGLLAFPLALGAGVAFGLRAWRARDRRAAVGLAIASLTLFALHRLDFADAALGICGDARSPADQMRDRARSATTATRRPLARSPRSGG